MRRLLPKWSDMPPFQQTTILFALEGLLLQFGTSVSSFGNNLFGTYLGASDQQIALIQLIPNLTGAALLLPLGMLGDKATSSRKIPSMLSLFLALSYVGLAMSPVMGEARLLMFFLCLAFTGGITANYNAQWQALFSDTVGARDQSRTFSFRSRTMNMLGTLLPMLMGSVLAGIALTANKLETLRLFYFASAVCFALQHLIIRRLPTRPRQGEAPPSRAGQVLITARAMAKDRRFRSYIVSILVFYLFWHIDWSMWYIAQSQYCHMNEFHLSLTSGLGCIASVLTIGFWAKKRETIPAEKIFLWCTAGFSLSPLAVYAGALSPAALGPWMFLTLNVLACCLQSSNSLLIMQMLMARLPQTNRMVALSLYTLLITLSNAFMPLVGVELYTLFGSDLKALLLFYAVVWGGRACAFLIFWLRWRVQARAIREGTAA